MPIATREAQIVWEGSLAAGAGTVSSGSGALAQLPVTWASRTEQPEGKTSPEELIGGAHVGTAVWSEALLTSWPSSFDESPQVSSKPGALQKGARRGNAPGLPGICETAVAVPVDTCIHRRAGICG